MDYEKKYKAVLNTATQWIKDGCTDKEKMCLECVFPELRESEDERIRQKLLSLVEWSSSFYGGGITRKEVDEIRAYIEKQKPAEWSEEDENRVQAVVDLLENTSAIHPNYSHRKLIIWLKSLRPSWKPSEEQMSMLLAVINDPNNAGSESCHLALISIYEQLQKLNP